MVIPFILQVHFPSFLKDMSDAVKELDRQVAIGNIKYYGVSNFGPKNIKALYDAGGKPVTNQVLYFQFPEY